MLKIKIDKDIFVRDKYNVRRRTFVAGQVVDKYVYNAILRTNTVLNPEDLPVQPDLNDRPSINRGTMEYKVLPLQEQSIVEPVEFGEGVEEEAPEEEPEEVSPAVVQRKTKKRKAKK